MSCMKVAAGDTVDVRLDLCVQPDLWYGRQVGEWTAQEHQQVAMGLTAYGTEWARIQRLMVPSRSVIEVSTARRIAKLVCG